MIKSILVPGSGATAGINTIKSLKLGGFSGTITATDSSDLSAGFYLANKSHVLPEIEEDNYFARLKDLIIQNYIDLLMPSSGFDIIPFSKFKKEIKDLNATPVVSDIRTIENCIDKMKTFDLLNKKFDLPFTTTNPDSIENFPVFTKPRYGKGGRDSFILENKEELHYFNKKFDNMIFQEFLPGKELTIDVLSDLEGNPLIAVPRIRLKVKGGISIQGKIIRDEQIESICLDLAKTLGIHGPCCIQMKETKEGKMKLVEINPRLGGGTIFATLAGVNFPAMIVDLVEKNEVVIPKISEITVIRYFEEIITK